MPYKNKEDRRRHDRKRYADNPEVRRTTQEATAKWESTLPTGRWYTPEYGRRKQLERRHRITPEQYDAQLKEQGGHCALCPKTQGDDKRRMAVDHSHACCDTELACGKCNRGILCADCNRKVGFLEAVLKEGTIVPILGTWLDRTMQYLKKYQDSKV
jgi:Recombination endonuclease VII